ncbi:MAG: ATPase, partial [Verrucomicrobiota bacterium]|nr:ATPase [Verrucomicrobiota bacterium]
MKSKFSRLDFSMAVALAAIWIFFAISAPAFLSARNLAMLSIELSITAVLALGMFFVLVPRQIDLSVGSGVGLIGGISAVLVFFHHWPAWGAMLAGLFTALVLWWLMGLLIVKQRVPSFIITLGGLLIFKGLFWLVIQDSTVPISTGPDNILSLLTTFYFSPRAGFVLVTGVSVALLWQKMRARKLEQNEGLPLEPPGWAFGKLAAVVGVLYLAVFILNRFRGLPLSLLILCVVAFGVHVVSRHTRFGRYLYAIG